MSNNQDTRDNNQTITNNQIRITKRQLLRQFGYWFFGFGICLYLVPTSLLSYIRYFGIPIFRFIGIIGISWLLVINHCAFAEAKEYDGIWFLGFNLKREVTKNADVRQGVDISINKDYIVEEIVSKEVVPVGIIPPGMLGYDPDLAPRDHDLKYAKSLMNQAGFPITDKRLKTLTLLHTDGVKTAAIAKSLQNDLRNIGMKISLVEVSFKDEEKWVQEMASGKYDFFLMGYKAGIEQLFSEEASVETQVDSYSLVEPLFATSGEANFTGYSNTEVDTLLKHLTGLNIALKSERHAKLKKINGLLYKDLPVVVLFYIEKL